MPTPTAPSSSGSIIVISFPFLLPVDNQWTTRISYIALKYQEFSVCPREILDTHTRPPLPPSPQHRAEGVPQEQGWLSSIGNPRQVLSACLGCFDTHPLLPCGQRPYRRSPWVTVQHLSQQILVCKTEIPSFTSYDDVIKNRNSKQLTCFHQPLR
jgi:hypothetical protein